MYNKSVPLINLQKILNQKQMSQVALANELHVTKSTVNGYCKCNSTPGFDIVFHICNYLNVTVEDLFGLTEESYVLTKEDMELVLYHQNEISKILSKYGKK